MSPSLLPELDGVNFASASPDVLTTVGSSGRAIDRFSPHLHDPLRAKKSLDAVRESDAYKRPPEKSVPAPQRVVSPNSSSRYLLADSAQLDDLWYSQPDIVVDDEPWRLQESTVTVPQEESWSAQYMEDHECCSATSTTPQNHQVVVLGVSLHCKGCEGKVRKHISKMEGVTSFMTDLVNKKVTVIGDVTPLGVLNSVSKVKNAWLWKSLPPSAPSS